MAKTEQIQFYYFCMQCTKVQRAIQAISAFHFLIPIAVICPICIETTAEGLKLRSIIGAATDWKLRWTVSQSILHYNTNEKVL